MHSLYVHIYIFYIVVSFFDFFHTVQLNMNNFQSDPFDL